MSDPSGHEDVDLELKRLTSEFFAAVSFEAGKRPSYERIHGLFVAGGLLIKNSGSAPEISTVHQFIEPRQASVESGELTQFSEVEISGVTQVFGNVAHRFSAYAKSGALKSAVFRARGMVSTQFVLTPAGWRISAMAWDDERPGVSLPEHATQRLRS